MKKHWAFIKPKNQRVPKVVANPIDAFLQQRLAKGGLKPAPVANPETLVRRIHLDLTGLPPSLKEVDEFLRDKSPNALEKLINQLMKRQTYGEHMARYWLDLARRLVERDVRTVQILHRGWDQHGSLPKQIREQCTDIDQPTAALIKDLK